MNEIENIIWNKNELKTVGYPTRVTIEGATQRYFKKSLEALSCLTGLIAEDEKWSYLEIFMNGFAEQERTGKEKVIIGYRVKAVSEDVVISILVEKLKKEKNEE